jgi:hypothetical protein
VFCWKVHLRFLLGHSGRLQGLSSGGLVAFVILRLNGCRHVTCNVQLEVVFRSKPTETCCGQVNIVFAGLGIGMIHWRSFLGYTIAEIPVTEERSIVRVAVGRKRTCPSLAIRRL